MYRARHRIGPYSHMRAQSIDLKGLIQKHGLEVATVIHFGAFLG